jgi:putative transposase
MKKTRFTEQQIAFALKQAETGTPVSEVTRKLGISEVTFYNWKKKYGSMAVTELRRLKQLEDENARLKKIAAELSLGKGMLQDGLKKSLTIRQLKMVVQRLVDQYKVSARQACEAVMLTRSVWCYKSVRRSDKAVRRRIVEIANTRIRHGVNRIYVLLRGEGWKDNKKRIHRIYKEEGGLNLRSKRPRRSKVAAHRMERPVLALPHQCWSMDFVADQLFNGRKFRVLTLVDNFSRQCLASSVGQSIKGMDVVRIMNDVKK